MSDNGSITFSIRVPYDVNELLDEISRQVNLPKNKLVNMMIEHCLRNMVVKDYKDLANEE